MPERKARKPRWFRGIRAVSALAIAAPAGVGVLLVLGSPPMVADAIESAEAARCMQRLRQTYQGFVQFQVKHRALPQTKPDPACFGRDMERFPLEVFPGDGSEPLVACGRKVPKHHPDVIHVLFADGSVKTLSLADLKARGAVPPDAPALSVGPDSPVPDLRKLRRD